MERRFVNNIYLEKIKGVRYNKLMTNPIDSSRVTYDRQVVLDPNFFAPPGVVDINYQTNEDFDTDVENDFFDPEAELSDAIIFDEISESLDLPVPENITIVSQTVRTRVDGTTTVDVVFEIEDFPGINEYELRVTKA